MKLAIIGAGGHAKSVIDIVKGKNFFLFDDKKKFLEIDNSKIKVSGSYKTISIFKKKISKVVVTIGNNNRRKKVYDILKKKKFKFATLIHPKSYFSIGSECGEGSTIMQGSLINTDSKIGKNCIINTNSSIDHDCVINDHTHICPGVTIAGQVTIGKNCWIGLGAKIVENCVIGDNVFVAAGSVVTKNIKSNSFVKGVPAKYAKKRLAEF